jgi:hypothetical protein
MWRFGYIGSNSLALNWGNQTGTLNHTQHTLQLTFPAGTDMIAKINGIYDSLKNFDQFNGGHNTVASKSVTEQNGARYVWFDSLGMLGLTSDLINPTEVPVRVWSRRSDHLVVADTAGMHMLVGQRRWQVLLVGGTTVQIRTESYDYPRDVLNQLGMWGLGETEQLRVWTEYFENIRDYYVSTDGAAVQSDVQGTRELLPGQDSPWSPADPYPGIEVP